MFVGEDGKKFRVFDLLKFIDKCCMFYTLDWNKVCCYIKTFKNKLTTQVFIIYVLFV